MAPNFTIRPAVANDVSDLLILFDAASRQLISWVWSLQAQQGQSWFEVGRNQLRDTTRPEASYLSWHVADSAGSVVGGLRSMRLADPFDTGDRSKMPPPLVPFLELQTLAGGSYYISVASVFPERRGQGIGEALLDHATSLARKTGADRLALTVESFNPGAERLYRRIGFHEQARRAFVPFPGTSDQGDILLMVKNL